MDLTTKGLIGKDHPLSKELPGFVRELGVYERLVVLKADSCMFQFSNAIFILSKEPLTTQILFPALDLLNDMLPILTCKIVNKFPNGTALREPVHCLMEEPFVDVEKLETEDWIGVVTKELSTPFDIYNGPLWRVKFLPNASRNYSNEVYSYECAVVFSYFHSVMDGMGYHYLYNHFLNMLEHVKLGETTKPAPLPVWPPLDYYVDLEEVKNSNIEQEPDLNNPPHPYLSKMSLPIDHDPNIEVEMRFIPIEFNKEFTKKIIKASKLNGTTVTGTLLASASVALAKILHGENIESEFSFTGYYSRNGRPLYGLPEDSYGMYVLMCSMNFEVKQGSDASDLFWSLARNCTEQLKTDLKERKFLEHYMSFSLMEEKRIDIATTAKYKNNRTEHVFYMASMGNCSMLDRDEKANFQVRARFGGANEQNYGGIFGHNISTICGRLLWSVIYSNHIVHKTTADQYAEEIQKILERHCYDLQ